MSNMGYCRFENTVNDLADCETHFGDTDLSHTERDARREMLEICKRILEDYGDELEQGASGRHGRTDGAR